MATRRAELGASGPCWRRARAARTGEVYKDGLLLILGGERDGEAAEGGKGDEAAYRRGHLPVRVGAGYRAARARRRRPQRQNRLKSPVGARNPLRGTHGNMLEETSSSCKDWSSLRSWGRARSMFRDRLRDLRAAGRMNRDERARGKARWPALQGLKLGEEADQGIQLLQAFTLQGNLRRGTTSAVLAQMRAAPAVGRPRRPRECGDGCCGARPFAAPTSAASGRSRSSRRSFSAVSIAGATLRPAERGGGPRGATVWPRVRAFRSIQGTDRAPRTGPPPPAALPISPTGRACRARRPAQRARPRSWGTSPAPAPSWP